MANFHVLSTCIATVVLAIFFGFTLSISISELNSSQFSGIEKCGLVNPVPGDLRTLMPWNVAIFKKTKDGPKFINSGVLIGHSAVLAVFGGVYGASYGRQKKYFIPPAESFMLVTGLNSTSLADADQFTQYAQVSYILPYNNHEEENKNFHFWLFHLSKPLSMTTPQVQDVCLPFFLRDLPTSWQLTHGGFSQLAKTPGVRTLAVSGAKALQDKDCNQLFRRSYPGSLSSDHVWCSRTVAANDEKDNPCMIHGSVLVAKLRTRYFLAGMTALIPDLKTGSSCNGNTNYVNAKIRSHYEWLTRNIQCGPNQYSCVNATCVPLSAACNQVQNCPDEDFVDEDPIFCRAQNRCRGPGETPCGLNGKCLEPHQICDGVRDCQDGSDEATQLCNPVLTNKNKKTPITPVPLDVRRIKPFFNPEPIRTWSCIPYPVSEGTVMHCYSPDTNVTIDCKKATENTLAVLSCEKHYSPKNKVSIVHMRCNENGRWTPFRPFECEANCGLLSADVTPLITNAKETDRKNAFPWYAAIFRQKAQGKYKFLCGATLIERRFVITAGHCAEDVHRSPYLRSQFKVVLAPVSSVYEENIKDKLAKIYDIKQVRIPALYDFKSLKSDIAVVELGTQVNFSRYIRPICYNFKFSQINPSIGRLGKVAGFGLDETGEIAYPLKYANIPIVDRGQCQRLLKIDLPNEVFCAGYTNGTALCSGDSGGGIVFLERGQNYEKYFLKGVVSASATESSNTRTCDTQSYSVFTNVDAFRPWILETLEAIDTES